MYNMVKKYWKIKDSFLIILLLKVMIILKIIAVEM